MDTWLAAREAGLPGWVARWAPDDTWDYSPSSLDRLTELLIRELGEDPEALRDPGNGDLVDGSAWYLGETYRRAGGGRWSWRNRPVVVNVRKVSVDDFDIPEWMLSEGYLDGLPSHDIYKHKRNRQSDEYEVAYRQYEQEMKRRGQADLLVDRDTF